MANNYTPKILFRGRLSKHSSALIGAYGPMFCRDEFDFGRLCGTIKKEKTIAIGENFVTSFRRDGQTKVT